MIEHEFEPVRGLPGELPAGERLIWQGAPRWQALARRVLHSRMFGVYLGLLLVWRAASTHYDTGSWAAGFSAILWPLPLVLAAIGLLWLIAWLMARTTVYSVTDRRIVMRVGVVLSVTFNIPFRTIESVEMRPYPDGTGDITLKLSGTDRIAYVHLWPHARPWHLKRTEPMLRVVPDAVSVAKLLSDALQSATAEGANGSEGGLQDAASHASGMGGSSLATVH
ncbi:MAG: photosynthetic complex putative assembly protein PuhB [Rhodocyclaceae bacterium]